MSDELSALSAYGSVGGRTCHQLLSCTVYENLSPSPCKWDFPCLNFFHNHFLKSALPLVHEGFFLKYFFPAQNLSLLKLEFTL